MWELCLIRVGACGLSIGIELVVCNGVWVKFKMQGRESGTICVQADTHYAMFDEVYDFYTFLLISDSSHLL